MLSLINCTNLSKIPLDKAKKKRDKHETVALSSWELDVGILLTRVAFTIMRRLENAAILHAN